MIFAQFHHGTTQLCGISGAVDNILASDCDYWNLVNLHLTQILFSGDFRLIWLTEHVFEG